MNLGSAIALSARALEALERGDDAGLLEALNEPLIPVPNPRDGMLTMAEMSAALGVEMTATFNFTIQSIVDQLRQSPEVADQAQALYLFDFRERFSKSDLGVQLNDATLRATLTGLLQMAGWAQEQIDAVLALGMVVKSPMQYKFERDATSEDVANHLAYVEQEQTRQDFDVLLPELTQEAYNTGNRQALIEGLRTLAERLGQ
jgi:hypothetical protein